MIDRLDPSARSAPIAAWPGWLPRRVDALAISTSWRVLAFVAIAVADLVFAGIAAAYVAEASRGQLAFLPTVGLLLALQKPFFDRLGRWAVGPRGTLFAWSWLAMLALPIVLGAGYALGTPIVTSHFRCGTGEVGLVLISPIVIGSVGSVGAWWLHALFARRHAWIGRAMVPVTATLLCITGAITAFHVYRAMRLPDAETYLATRPTLAHFGPMHPSGDAIPGDLVMQDHGIVAHRHCEPDAREEACVFRVARQERDLASSEPSTMHIESDASFHVISVPAAHALVVVDDQRIGSARPWYRGAVDDRTGHWIDVSASDVAHETSAPRAWVFGALAGFAIVAFVLVTQRRSRIRAEREVASFHEGEASIGGVVNFSDGTPPSSLAGPPGSIVGPVLARITAPGETAHYRTDGSLGPVEVLHGTRDDLRAAANDMLLGRWMYALAVMLVMCAPVLGFAWSLVSR